MTQDDKDFLLRDLCARLPYRVKYTCIDIKNVWRLKTIFTRSDNSVFCDGCNALELCKPYLFPLSSMTEEQKIIYGDLCYAVIRSLACDMQAVLNELVDWLNKNHFDYRGLIKKGLAIDATNLGIYN